jgi:hypothetical protein
MEHFILKRFIVVILLLINALPVNAVNVSREEYNLDDFLKSKKYAEKKLNEVSNCEPKIY